MTERIMRLLVRSALWIATATDDQHTYHHLAAAWVALNPEES